MEDIEIARKAKLENITKIATKLGIDEEYIEQYGKYKAKISCKLYEKLEKKDNGKLILVTAINPTPLGEGKTTISIGLADGLNRIGKKTVLALREPSLGPVFGIKGGATGGGYSQIAPMEDINLHFTGDIHAITSANNLLSAMIDNHIYYGNKLQIEKVVWKRCVDLNDRQLRKIQTGLSGESKIVPREDGFDISVASEIMAIVCLSENIEELKQRLGNIIIGYNKKEEPIFSKDLKAEGAMAVLLKDAIKPNLVQTLEHTPAIIHGGPFANIAHGCSSVIATKLGMELAEYTVTEAGFGADLGAEKFIDIKCRKAQIKPDVVICVATIKALKYHGGMPIEDIKEDKKVVKNDEYTIKIIPNKTDDVKLFTISKNMFRYVMASVVIMIVLVVGSLSFAGYVYFNNQADKQHLQELQEANALQQQQLSELDKKANSLKEDMDQLNNLENELKQLSGIELPEGNNGDSVNPEQNGQGGPYLQTPTIENVRLTLDTVENTMNGKLNNMEELKKRLQTAIMMKRQQVAIANQTISITPSIWPAKGVVSSPYGLRWGGSDFHPGIDIANDMGTPIRATADGVVSIAGWNSGGYGNMVDIDHGNGVMTRYGHASYVVVSAGQQVKRGQIIAYMGSTGFSTGPHVHYEVRINGQAVDPSGYLFN